MTLQVRALLAATLASFFFASGWKVCSWRASAAAEALRAAQASEYAQRATDARVEAEIDAQATSGREIQFLEMTSELSRDFDRRIRSIRNGKLAEITADGCVVIDWHGFRRVFDESGLRSVPGPDSKGDPDGGDGWIPLDP